MDLLSFLLWKGGAKGAVRATALDRAFFQSLGGKGKLMTVTGVSPLTLANAVAAKMKSLTQTGRCVQASDPTQDSPVDICCNNGAVKWSANKLNMSADYICVGYYIDNTGAEKTSDANFYCDYWIPVKPSTTYTLSTSAALSYVSYMEYNSTDGFLKRTLKTSPGTSSSITTRGDTEYVKIGSNMTGAAVTLEDVLAVDWMFTEGSTAQPYVPFVSEEGGLCAVGTPEVITLGTQTAGAKDLLGVDGAADYQEIIGGTLVRQTVAAVLDGSESYQDTADFGGCVMLQDFVYNKGALPDFTPICTHFKGIPAVSGGTQNMNTCFFDDSGYDTLYFRTSKTAAQFASWAAAQYAAGTPVLCVFGASGMSDRVNKQPLETAAGDNTLTVTAEVSGIELTAEYYGTGA